MNIYLLIIITNTRDPVITVYLDPDKAINQAKVHTHIFSNIGLPGVKTYENHPAFLFHATITQGNIRIYVQKETIEREQRKTV